MSATVVAVPTLCNPEALSTVEELRRELGIANDNIFMQSCEMLKLHDQFFQSQMAALNLDRMLQGLIVTYLNGDVKSLVAELDRMAAHFKARQQAAGGVH